MKFFKVMMEISTGDEKFTNGKLLNFLMAHNDGAFPMDSGSTISVSLIHVKEVECEN